MLRFITYALPALLLLLALFGFTVELLDAEPRQGSVIRLALFDAPSIPAPVVLGAWLMEASGLLALFLLARGRCGAWWLDGLVTGWLAWIFRGPLLVITLVVAARQPQHPWWTLVFGWWVLYSVCGLFLAHLARRSNLDEDDVEEMGRGESENAGESEETDQGEGKDVEPRSSDLDAPEALLEEPESEQEPGAPASDSSVPLMTEENPPSAEPKAAVEPYPSSEEDSSPSHRAEENTAANSETENAMPQEMPPEESTGAPDKSTVDQPEQGKSGPKPGAEET